MLINTSRHDLKCHLGSPETQTEPVTIMPLVTDTFQMRIWILVLLAKIQDLITSLICDSGHSNVEGWLGLEGTHHLVTLLTARMPRLPDTRMGGGELCRTPAPSDHPGRGRVARALGGGKLLSTLLGTSGISRRKETWVVAEAGGSIVALEKCGREGDSGGVSGNPAREERLEEQRMLL